MHKRPETRCDQYTYAILNQMLHVQDGLAGKEWLQDVLSGFCSSIVAQRERRFCLRKCVVQNRIFCPFILMVVYVMECRRVREVELESVRYHTYYTLKHI